MIDDFPDFAQNRSKYLDGDFINRERIGKNLLSFGIDFLDDALFGIAPHEVILVGAESGAGKTQLVSNVAMHNLLQGKKVHFYALEAHYLEIEHRIIFQLLIDILKRDNKKPWPSYEEYYYRLHEFHVEELEAQELFKKTLGNLATFYKTAENFTVQDFKGLYASSALSNADLIIVDHAHYFDWGDKSDYHGLKEVITKARFCADTYGIPCLLVSHMRKPDPRVKTLAPSMHDFHGTSELYKRANKAFTLGKGKYDPHNRTAHTYCNAIKQRMNGQVTTVTARMIFDFRTTSYAPGYSLGLLNTDKEFDDKGNFQKLESLPSWAKRARGDRGKV